MKIAFKFVLILGISASLMLISGCSKKSPAPLSVKDQQTALLTKGPWKVTAATKDNVDQMADYGAAVMTLTKGSDISYVFAGLDASKKFPWKKIPGGSFTFDSTDPATTLVLDALYTVTYAVTSTQLIMSFTYTGTGNAGGRVSVVTGAWQYTFVHP